MTIAKAMKPEEALALLKKYGASDSVIEHVKAVRDYAMEMAEKLDCDPALVEAGALLHDIGRSRTHGIEHAVVGAKILRDEGVDEKIVRIVETHVGAGIAREDAAFLGLPPGDYVPHTIEEKIVCQADNLVGSRDRISIHDAIAAAKEKWAPGGLDRLIKLQFDVFKPVEVPLSKQSCTDGYLGDMLEEMDILYKKYVKNGQCIVALYGQDAEKAAGRLKKMDSHQ
jgi:uncharacterized protein (TIGR00295 family)